MGEILPPSTIIDRLVRMGISPVKAAFLPSSNREHSSHDGIVDTIRSLIMHEHFIKQSYCIVTLLLALICTFVYYMCKTI